MTAKGTGEFIRLIVHITATDALTPIARINEMIIFWFIIASVILAITVKGRSHSALHWFLLELY
ncbi:hypothetical protein SISNIDRAFT_487530 [Sistotremastrum niveocremeum HHB9708]|nr:hypothetical protein SISNIDRAFT_487530 [Sistotremastrum niveocremeum HHB9708]